MSPKGHICYFVGERPLPFLPYHGLQEGVLVLNMENWAKSAGL